MDLAIIKRPPEPPHIDRYILAMFLLYARAHRNPMPDLDGMYDLQEIGEAPEKDWERLTPYSLARAK